MLKVGRRKLFAVVAAVVVAAAGSAAWWFLGTAALIAVLLIVMIFSSLVLGWLVAQSERRVSRKIDAVKREVRNYQQGWDEFEERMDRSLSERLDDAIGRVAVDSRGQMESLLKAAKSWINRAKVAQQRLLDAQQNIVLEQRKAVTSLDGVSKSLGRESSRVIDEVRSHSPSLKQLRWETKQLFRQIEGLLALYAAARPTTAFPQTRTWAAAPDLLSFLYHTVRKRRPHLILECGSGVSTLVMGYAVKANGVGQIVSLEHLESYRDTALDWVAEHDLAQWIDVRLAPLEEVEVDGEEWSWYSMDAVPSSKVDILFVDGPPGPSRRNARFPALPLLVDRLRFGSIVILDDYSREDETMVTERWREMFPEFEMTTLDHEKGTALFVVPLDDDGT